jgi:hypothetical protein
MSFCKYCHRPIQWVEQRPCDADGSFHSFDVCKSYRVADRKARKEAKLAPIAKKYADAPTIAPVGSFLVYAAFHPSDSTALGIVVGHNKFKRSQGCKQRHGEIQIAAVSGEVGSAALGGGVLVVDKAEYIAALHRRISRDARHAENLVDAAERHLHKILNT